MNMIDPDRIAVLHAAARRERALYVHGLLRRLGGRLARFFEARPSTRAASCS